MSIKSEIKSLIDSDLSNSMHQTFMNGIYDEIKSSIQNPGVQFMFIKLFEEPKTDDEQNIIKMICQKDLGFVPYVDERQIVFILMDFLK